MKKNIIKRIIKLSVFIVLLVSLLTTVVYINITLFKNIPNVSEFYRINPDMPPITTTDINNFRISNNQMITYSTVKSLNIYTPTGKAYSINAVYTDKFYKELYNVNILYGHFFTKDGAVISRKLSENLFNTADGVGYKIFIDNNCYTVTGIYKDNNIFCNERVYLPSKENLNADVITFNGDKQFKYYTTLFPSEIEYKFTGYMGVGLKKEINILKVNNNIILIIFTILFTVKMARINMSFYKEMRDRVSVSLNDNYFFDAVKINRKTVLKFILILLLSSAILIFLLIILAKPVPLPLDLTTKNIFDYKFFKNAIYKRLSFQYKILNPICIYWIDYIKYYIISYVLVLACSPLIILLFKPRR